MCATGPQLHSELAAELGLKLRPSYLGGTHPREEAGRHDFRQQVVGEGEVALSGRATGVPFLLGLVWDFCFLKGMSRTLSLPRSCWPERNSTLGHKCVCG